MINCDHNCFECKFDECLATAMDLGKSERNHLYYIRHREQELTRCKAYAKSHRQQINATKRKNYKPEQRRKWYLAEKKRKLESLLQST